MRTVLTTLLCTAAVALAVLPAAQANDSTAELANGGLIFVRNPDVEMRSEELTISTQRIDVRYRFFNRADTDVTVLVAFPMPEVRIDHMDANIAVPTDDPVNLLGFTTRVNGRPVTTEVEQRVTAAGLDRTALLRGLGIPLAPHLAGTNEALDRLPRAQRDDLIRLGLAEIEEYDIGKGMEQHLSARWALNTTFYWQQTFPARAETVIEHSYRPSVGQSVGTLVGFRPAGRDPLLFDYEGRYCTDQSLLDAVARAAKAVGGDDPTPPFTEARIDYVLSTGANWSGPIGEFRLVVDKGDPANLVSFCGEDVRKIAPTQFEMRKTDYWPEGDFSVLILERMTGR